jgi:tRNA(Ile)-lysidine synthase
VIQLSGNFQVMRRGEEFVLRRRVGHTSASRALPDDAVELPREAGAPPAVVGAWRFVVADDATAMLDEATDGRWSCWLPAGEAAVARPWRSGDRMRSPTSGAARRVKRFFGDAGVAGVDRAGWPVVVVNGEIVWIPGVRRAHAAPARSDRPGVWLTCRTVRESTHR